MNFTKNSADFNYYSRFESGHRADYMDFVSRAFGANRVNLFQTFFSKKPVLFLMIEERPLLFFIISIVRNILGRRTSGLLFRVESIINKNSLKMRIKFSALKFLSKLKLTSVISIVPENISPEVMTFCSHSIYDFQFWDVCTDCNNQASSHNLMVLGRQDNDKGFHYLPQFLALFEDNVQVKVKGKVVENCKYIVNELNNSTHAVDIEDAFVSNESLLNAYKIAQYVWCCYSPKYNQSSGILGRAIQFGNVPIVRAGSISETYCKLLSDKYIAVVIEKEKLHSYNIRLGKNYRTQLQEMPEYFLDILLGNIDVKHFS